MKAAKSFAEKLFSYRWFYPLVLLAIGVIAYGLMLPRLGFYWDDWEAVYLNQLHNPALSFSFFNERPFSTLAYLIFFPLVKMTPLAWQILGLLLRWAGILFLYFTFNLIWPKRVWQNCWIAALLIVFPGYLVQPLPATFTRHYLTFLFFSVSLFLTVLALKDRKHFWLWMPLSVFLGVLQMFMMEYFVGLEILRPVLIWLILQQQEEKERVLRKTLLYWLPFMIGLAFYAWWRFLYLPSTLPADPNSPSLLKALFRSPVESVKQLVQFGFKDIWYLLARVWFSPFSSANVNFYAKITWISLFLGGITALLFSLYVKSKYEKKVIEKQEFIQQIIIGGLALVGGAMPIWAMDKQISANIHWFDRFTLAPMLGAVILVVSIIDWVFRTRAQKQWLCAILLASSIYIQIYTDNIYAHDWDLQRNLYWQLAWRIPSLKPGTIIIGSGAFTDKSAVSDDSYAINILFSKPVQVPLRDAYNSIEFIKPDDFHLNIPVVLPFRGGSFLGNTSQAVVMYFDQSGGCVRLLDSVYAETPKGTQDINNLVPISNLNLILPSNSPTSPNPDIFGTEPSHGWCYYFEKADLARQMGDWQSVLQFGAEAESEGLQPLLGQEYIPFIEANALTGHWSKAFDLSQKAIALDPQMGNNLCNNWNQFSTIKPGSNQNPYLEKAQTRFCTVTSP
ncbi:MAG: hypothetical protein WCE68_01700 [Anaerolineales bacterium]